MSDLNFQHPVSKMLKSSKPIVSSPKENKDRKWISGKDSAAEHQSSIIGHLKTKQPNKRQQNRNQTQMFEPALYFC